MTESWNIWRQSIENAKPHKTCAAGLKLYLSCKLRKLTPNNALHSSSIVYLRFHTLLKTDCELNTQFIMISIDVMDYSSDIRYIFELISFCTSRFKSNRRFN